MVLSKDGKMTQNFKNLNVYGEAFGLSRDIYIFFQDKHVSHRAKEQVMASASSICANLAEMAAFESKPQQKQKLLTCIGEANETEFWLDMMLELKVLPEKDHLGFIERVVRIRSMLFNLRRSMAREI